MLKYVADQIGTDPTAFTTYAHRDETRRQRNAAGFIQAALPSFPDGQ